MTLADSLNQTFPTRDIVTIAILASLGGALSTFIGYLGNLINLALGVPFGAGQFMAGLHVFWIIIMRLLVPRFGVGTAGGLLKGMVELFTGSTHGIVIVVVSLIQGTLVDITAHFGGSTSKANSDNRLVWWLGAGAATASNVFVFHLIFFLGVPLAVISTIAILAFCSGVIFAGYFAWETFYFLGEAGFGPVPRTIEPQSKTRGGIVVRNISSVGFILFLMVGSLFYAFAVARPFADPYACDVVGLVENPYIFRTADFAGSEVTVEAELIGAYIHIAPTNYTGILVSSILALAEPNSEATGLRVTARDGYMIQFELSNVMTDKAFLLTENEDGFWLVAGNYDGSLWVQSVVQLEVY